MYDLCPNCGAQMDVLTNEGLRVCPNCKSLAWDEDGTTEWRIAEKLSPEEVAALEAEDDGISEYPILVPHADFGDPECCGIIMPVASGNQADLQCNECGTVISTVPAAEADPTLLRMAMSLGFCSETCPVCSDVNTFTGYSSMEAYTCRHCGAAVLVKRPVQ